MSGGVSLLAISLQLVIIFWVAERDRIPPGPACITIDKNFLKNPYLCYAICMEIRKPGKHEKDEIVQLYKKVQSLTGIPNPDHVSPDELEGRIYSDRAIEQYVVDHLGRIAGHALIELPDPGHIEAWKAGIGTEAPSTMIELGGAFVDPELKGLGIWTTLLVHRLKVIEEIGAIPVSATWTQNQHVKRTFQKHGGMEVGQQRLPAGDVSLFVFNHDK